MKQDRNHVISAGYIRNWSVDDFVMCELVPERKRRLLAPSQVGVRKKFYAGSAKDDGTRTAEPAEHARGLVETKALPLLRELADHWPLQDTAQRAWVALWLAMTLCSSPHQRGFIPRTVQRFFSSIERTDPMFAAITRRTRDEFAEPDFELDSMFEEVSTVASLMGQMHWALLRFSRPELVSSDHPIDTVLWTSDGNRSAGAPSGLVCDSCEIRIPIGPSAALLLSWADRDDRVDPINARRHHVSAVNRGVWIRAERHRFWQPGQTPRGVDDSRPSARLSVELFPDYDPKTCRRLDVALAWHTARLRAQQGGVEDRAVITAIMEHTSSGLVMTHQRHDGQHAAVFSDFQL
ncbi:DUF4238 domain-containing protein [Solirubrobacter taibaiensis]|nr:DUF4238 domain-containing protein [Solirubrobacter taibaiensis]